MLTLIHHQGCSKSRAALALSEAAAAKLDLPLQVIDYRQHPLSLAELQQLQAQLGLPVRAMLRDTDDLYSQLGLADATLSEQQLLSAIAAHPVLLQRPILVRDGRAVIARPPELVLSLLS